MVEAAGKGSRGKGRVTVKVWRGHEETQETSWFQGKKVHNGARAGRRRPKVTEGEDPLQPAQADTARGSRLGLHVGAVAVGAVAMSGRGGLRRESTQSMQVSPRVVLHPSSDQGQELGRTQRQELLEEGLAGPR